MDPEDPEDVHTVSWVPETKRWKALQKFIEQFVKNPGALVNEATEFFTPIFSSTTSSVTGMVALLDAVAKPNICIGRICFKNTVGFKPVNTLNKLV